MPRPSWPDIPIIAPDIGGAWRSATLALITAVAVHLPVDVAPAQGRPDTAKAGKAAPAKANPDESSASQGAASGDDEIKRRAQELDAARAQQRDAQEASRKLAEEVAAISQDRTKLNQQLIEGANRVRTIETRIDDSEKRLRPLDARETQIRQSLDARRGEIVEVLAALQRAGRRTPPAMLVRPEDALQSLRTAMLLGAVVPDMRARMNVLATDLGELIAVRQQIATERDRLAASRDTMTADQRRLAALVEERQKKQSETETGLEAERQRASTMARQVDSLQGLITKMEQELKTAAKVAALASNTVTPSPPSGRAAASVFRDSSRQSPAIAFASARALLPLPVNGTRIRSFGASDGAGGQEKGLSIATRPGAQITTPCDGWVVYSGPFRSYGQLLILNAGGGYHVLIAGMERISVNIGQFVLTGEPVATMGSSSQVASVLATAPSQPVLYIEFRKDGTPIDSGPWWASEGEKVRG